VRRNKQGERDSKREGERGGVSERKGRGGRGERER
jgi:hypothetical protein